MCNARNCVVVEDEYNFLLICDDYKLLRHRYVTKHLPPYDETQNGFKIFINLKGLAQAKIIKKSMILFWLLNMTISCKHVHRLKQQFFLIFLLRIHQLD